MSGTSSLPTAASNRQFATAPVRSVPLGRVRSAILTVGLIAAVAACSNAAPTGSSSKTVPVGATSSAPSIPQPGAVTPSGIDSAATSASGCPDPAMIADATKASFDTLTVSGDFLGGGDRVGSCTYTMTKGGVSYDATTGANSVAIESGGLPLGAETSGPQGTTSWLVEPVQGFGEGAKVGRATGAMGELRCRISFQGAATVVRVVVSAGAQKGGQVDGLCEQARTVAQAIPTS